MTSPNIHEYIKTTTVQPWPTTSFLLLNLLGEICWNCSPRIDVSEFGFQRVKDKGIDDLVLMHHGKCPVCGATRHDMVTTGRYSIPHIANIVLGQRSGKSIVVSILTHYYEHRIKHWLDSGLGTVQNSQYYWIGKMDALQVTPQLTDANTATVTITIQSAFFGAYTI
jgi:hypothetical protein